MTDDVIVALGNLDDNDDDNDYDENRVLFYTAIAVQMSCHENHNHCRSYIHPHTLMVIEK